MEDIYATRSFKLVWTFRENKLIPELTGLTFDQPLKPGINEAQCPFARSKHKAPHPRCTCGFYCYDDPEGSLWPGRVQPRESIIDAVVRISGSVVVHGSGLRAQHIEIVAFSTSLDDERKALAILFPSVPIFNTLDYALTEFPVTALTRDEKLTQPSFAGLALNALGVFATLVGIPVLFWALFLLPNAELLKEPFEIHGTAKLIYPGLVGFAMYFAGGYLQGFVFSPLYWLGRLLKASSVFLILCSLGALAVTAVNPNIATTAESLVALVGMLSLLVVRAGSVILACLVTPLALLLGDNVNLRRRPTSFELPTKLKDSLEG